MRGGTGCSDFPCIRSLVKTQPAWQNLARPGFPGFLPSLSGKCGPVKPGKPGCAKFSWQPWPQKSGFLGHVNSRARLSRQPWPKKKNLASLAIKPEAFLDFQALKSSLEKPSIFSHVVPEKDVSYSINVTFFSWSESYWLLLLIPS